MKIFKTRSFVHQLSVIILITLISVMVAPLSFVKADEDTAEGNFTVSLGIYNIRVSDVSTSSATITWVTNSPATSEVFYDTVTRTSATSYEQKTTDRQRLAEVHQISLYGLISSTKYHFRVKSTIPDSGENVTSGEYTFKTLAPTGGGETTKPVVDTDLFGIEEDIPISDEGEVLETIEGTSSDGNLSVNITKGTIAKEKDGTRLKSLTIDIYENPPDPPEESNFIGLSYDFGPDGSTFDPPMTVTFNYDPDILGDVSEESLVLAYYDDENDLWVELESVVDIEKKTVTARVPHFTIFAVIGKTVEKPKVEGKEEEEKPVVEEEEKPLPEEEKPLPEEEKPLPEEEKPSEKEEEPITPREINWPLIVGIIVGGLLLISFVFYLLIKRINLKTLVKTSFSKLRNLISRRK